MGRQSYKTKPSFLNKLGLTTKSDRERSEQDRVVGDILNALTTREEIPEQNLGGLDQGTGQEFTLPARGQTVVNEEAGLNTASPNVLEGLLRGAQATNPTALGKFAVEQMGGVGAQGEGTQNTFDKHITSLVENNQMDVGEAAKLLKPPLLKIDQTKEIAQDETWGTFLAEDEIRFLNIDRKARETIVKWKQVEKLGSQVKTGALAGSAKTVRKLGEALGFEVDESLGYAEALSAVNSEISLDLRSTEGGGGLPGNFSDQDRNYLESMTPGLGMTQKGRKILVAAKVRLEERKMKVSEFARNYAIKHGGLDREFYAKMKVFKDKLDKENIFTGLRAVLKVGVDRTNGRNVIYYQNGDLEYAD